MAKANTCSINFFHALLQVNAFGFMGDPDNYTSHYYDEKFTKTRIQKARWHDWLAENKLWKLLIDEGILSMYTRN